MGDQIRNGVLGATFHDAAEFGLLLRLQFLQGLPVAAGFPMVSPGLRLCVTGLAQLLADTGSPSLVRLRFRRARAADGRCLPLFGSGAFAHGRCQSLLRLLLGPFA